jgi:ElaA protein
MDAVLHDEPFAGLDTTTLYALLQLRAEVFVVEQACAYLDPDGRDVEPTTRHVWWDEAGAPVAYLRVLTQVDGSLRIGRVVTAPRARRRGRAEQLVRHVLDGAPADVSIVLAAQAHLAGWYRRLGFEVTGPVFTEDGIDHVPMRRIG